jgi:hypothetical protein
MEILKIIDFTDAHGSGRMGDLSEDFFGPIYIN